MCIDPLTKGIIFSMMWVKVEESGGSVTSFLGKYYYTLDPKGRIIIPAPLREILSKKYSSSKLYITNAAFDKCLHLYPLDEWARLEAKIREMPRMDEAVKYFIRRVVASAMECELDRQGRVLIPYEHRQDAGITGDIVIVGQIEKIELWDKAQWDEETDPRKVDRKAFETALAKYGL